MKRGDKIKITIRLALSVVITFFFYTFFHEMGHGIVAIACGGKIVEVRLGFDAYIVTANGQYDSFTLPLMNIAGFLLPYLILLIVLLVYKRVSELYIYQCIVSFFSVTVACSVAPWVIIPVYSMFETTPPDDDVTKFLYNITAHPLVVSASAVYFMAVLIFLINKKGVWHRFVWLNRAMFIKTDAVKINKGD